MKIEVIGNNIFINGDEWVKKEQPTPKDGEVMYVQTKSNIEWLFIYKQGGVKTNCYVVYHISANVIDYTTLMVCYTSKIANIRPATPEETALLHTKLAENGKVWNAEKKVLEDLPKPLKEGELAIFWNFKNSAIIATYRNSRNGMHITTGSLSYINAIPFESIEQYLEFIKS